MWKNYNINIVKHPNSISKFTDFYPEKATNANNPAEDWSVIMDICDKAGRNTDEAKNYLKVILKRLGNSDPHVAIQAATVWYYLFFVCINYKKKRMIYVHSTLISKD